MAQKTTIIDVAKMAGVSSSTVSHVLSGKRPISADVCNRVKKIIKELGYKPNCVAKSLVSRKSMQIGVVIDEVDNSISGSLVEAISEYLRKNGYSLILGICGRDIDVAKEYIENFCSGMVDGIINMIGGLNPAEVSTLCDGVPNVSYMRAADSPVTFDKLGGAILVMEHLWGLGHRKVGFISSQVHSKGTLEDRELGYRQFLTRKNVSVDEALIVKGDDMTASGFTCAKQLYDQGVSAIFAANDMMAVGVLQWAYEMGLRIPDQLSVAGFDDAPIARAVVPGLTTVQMPICQLAEKTVDGLFRRMKGRELGQTEILSPRLMVRKSTSLYRENSEK